MSPQDCALVHRARDGDTRAFGILIERYSPLVYSEVLRYVKQSDDADDLVQDVFCKAFQQIDRLQHPQLFPMWLRRSATNTALSWGRSRQCRTRLFGEVAAAHRTHEEGPDADYESRQTSEALHLCIETLPTAQRRALTLRYMEGCSYNQIARILGVSTASVKLYLRNGKQRLKGRWRDLQKGTVA